MTVPQEIRSFGDCEIHSISFTEDAAHLRLFDSFDFNYFTVVFRGLRYMLFETNHYQNVLDSLAIFENWQDLKKHPSARTWLEKVDPSILEADLAGGRIAYFQPTAGGETLIVFEQFELES